MNLARPCSGLSTLATALAATLWLLPLHHGAADSLAPAPGVTLELCGDVDVDEVSSALAIEYQNEDFQHTMVTVACEGESARVRVIGPSHPRGRITDIDLRGVDEVAKPRVIALVAAEMWSAPDAPSNSTRREASDEVLSPAKVPPIRRYRSGPRAGLSLLSAHRETFVGRNTSRYGYSDHLSMLSMKIDWPMWPRLGVFGSYGQGSSDEIDVGGGSSDGMHWKRSELGVYVPVWRERFRLDIHVSTGTDEIIAVGAVATIDRNVVLPDYDFTTIGVDLAYAINEELSLLGWSSSYRAGMLGQHYRSPLGARAGLGLALDLKKHLQLELRAETLSLRGRDLASSGSYSDDLTTLEVGLNIVH